jgi:hypothetical protein
MYSKIRKIKEIPENEQLHNNILKNKYNIISNT